MLAPQEMCRAELNTAGAVCMAAKPQMKAGSACFHDMQSM